MLGEIESKARIIKKKKKLFAEKRAKIRTKVK